MIPKKGVISIDEMMKNEAESCEMVINGMPSGRIEREEKNTFGRFRLIY